MKHVLLITLLFFTSVGICIAQNQSMLSKKERSIVTVSALSATGNIPKLNIAFDEGLNNGLTINEAKEILIQIAAYCGFPRSLNAINALNEVTKQRKAKGINDVVGSEPQQLPANADRYTIGKRNLERLTGRPETTKAGYAIFIPVIEVFLKEHLFADIFSRGVLTDKERELVTISALSSMSGVTAQLQAHLAISMHQGFTETQLKEMLGIVASDVGKKEAEDGLAALNRVIAAGRN